MAGSTVAPASAQRTRFRSCGRLMGVSRGTTTSGRFSLSMTSAARSTRLRDSPWAMPASVFIEHGTTTIPPQRWLPLAIGAPRSRLLCTTKEPARIPSP